MNSVALLLELRQRGILLEACRDVIRYCPQHAITPTLLEQLKTHKADILEFLERYEERAAIMEFDGDLPRADAEKLAWKACCSC